MSDPPTLPTDLSASPTTATGRAWSGLERSHLVTITDPCPSCGARFDVPVPLGADGNTTIRSRTHAAGCVAPTDPPQPTRLQETAAP